MFPKDCSNLIYMQHAGSLLHANRRRTREESYGPCRHTRTCKMHRSARSMSTTGWTLLQQLLHAFSNCRDACSSSWLTQFRSSGGELKFSLSTSQVAEGQEPNSYETLPSLAHSASNPWRSDVSESELSVIWAGQELVLLCDTAGHYQLFFAVGRNPGPFIKIKCMSCGGLGFIPTFTTFFSPVLLVISLCWIQCQVSVPFCT